MAERSPSLRCRRLSAPAVLPEGAEALLLPFLLRRSCCCRLRSLRSVRSRSRAMLSRSHISASSALLLAEAHKNGPHASSHLSFVQQA
eukprot:scaffold223289_cov34-Prasinocladus_malaysianus.AAC.1